MKLIGECAGTFTLVFFGCGSALFMGGEIGLLGISLAFGLTLMVAIFSFGRRSGGHFNPAVSFGMLAAGRMSFVDYLMYSVVQIIGAVLASGALYLIVSGKQYGYDVTIDGFAQTGWSEYSMTSAFLFEFLATFLFVVIIYRITDNKKGDAVSYAGILIGVTLVVIHLTGITISGSSVNPARSIGPALFVQGEALAQLWLYIVAPLAGAGLGGLLCRTLHR